MSEKEPTPEKKVRKLFDDCSNCEKRYEITPENAVAYTHFKQPECNYLNLQCPHCNYRTIMFVGDATLELADKRGIHFFLDEYAEDRIYDLWFDLNGFEKPKTYELTDRMEETARKFGQALNNMPPEIFWDNIEGDGGHPYPNRWI